MAKQTAFVVLALVFFAAVMGMASASGSAPSVAPSSVESGEGPSGLDLAEGPNAYDNVIGTVSGSATDAAPVGGPVSEGTFPDLTPTASLPDNGAGALQATTVVAVAGVVGSFFF